MSITDQPVARQVEAFHEELATKAPEEILSVLRDERASLDRAGVPKAVPTAGSPMPDGPLLDVHGASTNLTDARGGRPAVIVTYRGEWCPYCNISLAAYQEHLVPRLRELGVELIALSPQRPDGSLTMQQKHDLTFTVLSDPGNQIARQLGIVNPPRSEEARAATAAFGIDVATTNADSTDDLPMPTAVIVDAEGIIRWIDVHPEYAFPTEPQAILDALRQVLNEADHRRAKTRTTPEP
jgi:peroxiredoxin